MGKLQNAVSSATEGVEAKYTNSGFNRAIGTVSETATDVYNVASNAIVLSLAKKWIGIGMVQLASTEGREQAKSVWTNAKSSVQNLLNMQGTSRSPDDDPTFDTSGPVINRQDFTKLWALQLDKYFMPLSQTFTLRAKKRLNISSLVDGVDIIQQTRKEAKTIDCSLRISLKENQTNLQIVDARNDVQRLSQFINELYESDMIFAVSNDMINNTFGVNYVIMTEYKFLPRTGMGTYTFEFSLTEVLFGEHMLTLDMSQIKPEGQITG